jgi:ubiquinone/menaquinone biosynthesis C-methylase UbiE
MKIKGNLQQTIEVYNRIAKDYAQQSAARINPGMLHEFADLLHNGNYILDAGSGSGRDSHYLSNMGFKVVGIDLSKNLLAEGKELYPDLDLREMDMRRMTFNDRTFEGLWSHASLLHLERSDVPKALAEFFRVLKQGGIVHILVKEGKGGNWVRDERSSGEARYFTFFGLEEMKKFVTDTGFLLIKAELFNKSNIDPKARNINWVRILARKD